MGKVSTLGVGYRNTIVIKFIENEDVAFHWCMPSPDLMPYLSRWATASQTEGSVNLLTNWNRGTVYRETEGC